MKPTELNGANKGGIPAVGRKNNYLVMPEDLYIEDREGEPYYDERHALPLVENTVRNIMTFGVKEIIHVVKAEVKDRGWQIVVTSGRQRTKHAREANKRLIAMGEEPMAVEVSYNKDNSDDKAFELNVSLNSHRQDDGMLANAKKAAEYINRRNATIKQAADLFRVSDQTVYDWLALLECCAPVQKAITEGKVKPSAAVKLSKLNVVDQRVELEKFIRESNGKAMTIKDAQRIVAKAQGKEIDRAELVKKAKKALKLLTDDERSLVFAEFAQQALLPEMSASE